MGKYINTLPTGEALPANGKADLLLTIEGAKRIPQPFIWVEDIVCVVSNGSFEAAAYCYSPEELKAFSIGSDYRPKTWMIVPNAKELAE